MLKNKKIIFAISLLLLAGSVITWRFFRVPTPEECGIDTLAFAEAGTIGEKKTYQLLIWPEAAEPMAVDRYERGDVVLFAPEDKQFSLAEKEGFFIAKIRMTERQASVLEQSLEIVRSGKRSGGRCETETLKRRRAAIDLARIGVAQDEQKGRIISDKIYEGDVVVEKKQ